MDACDKSVGPPQSTCSAVSQGDIITAYLINLESNLEPCNYDTNTLQLDTLNDINSSEQSSKLNKITSLDWEKCHNLKNSEAM